MNPSPESEVSLFAELDRLARAAAHQAYAPYSGFSVGAAVLLETGEMVSGCNVENASYRLTTCAEQNAIAAAVTRYGPKIRIRAVAVVNLTETPCQPCGGCRQTLAEFGASEVVVVYPGEAGTRVRSTVGELLPSAFEMKPV